jgi:hypothetical protein
VAGFRFGVCVKCTCVALALLGKYSSSMCSVLQTPKRSCMIKVLVRYCRGNAAHVRSYQHEQQHRLGDTLHCSRLLPAVVLLVLLPAAAEVAMPSSTGQGCFT